MEGLVQLIREPSFIFAAMAVVGVLFHYFKKAYRGDVGWNLLDYLLKDHPGSSAGMLGAVVGGVWAVVTSDTLEGAKMSLVVGSGFLLGYGLDSAINRAKPKSDPAMDQGQKQGGFALVKMLLVLAAVNSMFLLGGCGTTFKSPTEIPVDQSLSDPAKAAQKALNSANVILTASYMTVDQNRSDGVYTKEEALEILDRLDKLGREVDKAQDAFRVGQFFDAEHKAKILREAISLIHREVAAKARKP